MVLDAAPSVISMIAGAGDTLYIGTFIRNPDGNSAGGEVLALDPTTLVSTAIAPVQGFPYLRARDGVLYVADIASSGSIWRTSPGNPVETLVTGRPNPKALATDGTYVYWHEDTASPDPGSIDRLQIGTDVVEHLIDDGGYAMDVDADSVYYSTFGHDVYRIPKAGGARTSAGYATYPVADVQVIGDHLYWLELGFKLFGKALPDGATEVIATEPSLKSPQGFIEHDGDFYVADSAGGVERAPVTGGQLERISGGGDADYRPAIIGPYLYWAYLGEGKVWRCRY